MENTIDATKIQAWVHNLDPFLIQFTETFGVRWYGLAYMAGFVLGALMMIFIANRGRNTLPADRVTDFITYLVLGTMIGGRLGYAIFYSPDLLTDFSSKFPFWGVLAVWEGGMASHGGIIGVILAAVLFARRNPGVSWLHLGDLATLGGSLGIFFGRVANFINGELMGRTVNGDLPWAVKFPADMYRWAGYERQRLPGLADTVHQLGIGPESWDQWVGQYGTNAAARSQVHETIERIIQAVQSGNEAVTSRLALVLEARHPSQIYAALFEGLFTFLICAWVWRKPRKPGVIGALFLTLYAAIRIGTEQFRMPDAHLGFQIFGLTRGQILSIAMLAGAVLFLIWVTRRRVAPIAGWGPEARGSSTGEFRTS